MSYTFQIIDERHQQLVRDIDAQRANLDEEKRQLEEDRTRIGVAGAIAGPPPRCRFRAQKISVPFTLLCPT